MLRIEYKNQNYLDDLKAYYISSGYEVTLPSGRGVQAEFIVKKGKTKRDPVEIVTVDSDVVEIRISHITNEKRYIFKIDDSFYTLRGKTLEKTLDHKYISRDQIISKGKQIYPYLTIS